MTEIRNRQSPSQLPQDRENQPAAVAARRRGTQADADIQGAVLPSSTGRTATGVVTRGQVNATDAVTHIAVSASNLTGGAVGLGELRAPGGTLDAATVAGAR